LIITDVLIEQFNFSYKSLAEYANVPVNALEQFLEGKNIELQDINNISVNLLMLNFVLNYRPR
ncbi:MAG: HTH domain-containing protein, partial [Sporolactobacillus sp.]